MLAQADPVFRQKTEEHQQHAQRSIGKWFPRGRWWRFNLNLPGSSHPLQRLSRCWPYRRCWSARTFLGAGHHQALRALPQRCCPAALRWRTDLSYQQVTQGNAAVIVFHYRLLWSFWNASRPTKAGHYLWRSSFIVPVCVCCAFRYLAHWRREQYIRSGGTGRADGPGT